LRIDIKLKNRPIYQNLCLPPIPAPTLPFLLFYLCPCEDPIPPIPI